MDPPMVVGKQVHRDLPITHKTREEGDLVEAELRHDNRNESEIEIEDEVTRKQDIEELIGKAEKGLFWQCVHIPCLCTLKLLEDIIQKL